MTDVAARFIAPDSPNVLSGVLRRYFPYVPLAVPCWNRDTYRAISRCLLAREIADGPDLAQLRAALLDRLGVGDAVLCASGSLALELALRACGIRPGDEVMIPTFCCSAVVPPIIACGAIPVLADVGGGLNLTAATVDAALTRKTRVVIVPHLFGNPVEIESIIALVRGKNIHVIDDAAQALGATIDGRPVGSFGDFGIFSFGAEKICSGIGGGVLIAQDPKSTTSFAISAPSLSATLMQLLSTLAWRRWRRWTVPAESIVRRRLSPHEVPLPYRKERMSNLQAALAETLRIALDENLAARRARVAAYQALLGDSPGLHLIPHRAGSACLTQVVHFQGQGGEDIAALVIGALRNAGYEIQGSYVPIHLLRAFPQCVWDRVPNAQRLWTGLVELPCEPDVSLRDIEMIARIVKQVAQADRRD